MNTTTEKKRFTTRDVMVIAAMMVLTFAVYGAVALLGCLFGQRILRRHFQKAGIVK